MKSTLLAMFICTNCIVNSVCINVPKQESFLEIIMRIIKGGILASSHYVTLDGEECK